jgi:DNA-binding transcriptional regulator YhcF (GntR family)
MNVLAVDHGSSVPPYEQVRAQIAESVRAGRLIPGTRLPTVRQLADDLGLAINTVARAYRELETAGVVETRGRHGTYVAAAEDGDPAAEAAQQFAHTVRSLGVSRVEAIRLARAALDGLT